MATTININRTLLRAACMLAVEYVKNERKQAHEHMVDRVLSWQKQGWVSKMLGHKWSPPSREEIGHMIENEGLLRLEYRCAMNSYGKMLSIAKTLLVATEWSEDQTISVGLEEFGYLQSFFPEAIK